MVVAVIAVHPMQPAVDEVVNMASVGHLFMPATGAVDMSRLMAGTTRLRITPVRVDLAHREDMLVDVIAVRVVKVSVVQVVDVSLMKHGGVAAAWSMLVLVVRMGGVRVHIGHGAS